jgi:hypothetical protein
MARLSLLTAIALCTAAAGCHSLDTPLGGAKDGQVSKANFNAQVVDQTPASGAPAQDAAMANAAIDRYRTGKTKTSEKEAAPMVQLNLAPVN